MGHPTLEAPGDLPGACDPQMARNTRVHTDYEPVASAPGVFQLGLRGHERHVVD